MDELLRKAKQTVVVAATMSTESKREALRKMAEALIKNTEQILAENQIDLEEASGISDVMKDRLRLTAERIRGMADGMVKVSLLQDPVGRILETRETYNGLMINKVSVPFGVVAIIFESRPNVAADAAALAIMSGNVAVLRGGQESFRSCKAIVRILREGLKNGGFPEDLVQMVDDRTRDGANRLMRANGYVDLLIPRGGGGLIRSCIENATVPCIETGTGICHIYVDKDADTEMALSIVENAKTSRPSVCNAVEVCLVDREIAHSFLPRLANRLVQMQSDCGKHPVELRLDKEAAEMISGTLASENDFDTEFLDYILAVKVVDGVEEAITHIAKHSSHHSEAIITQNEKTADIFTACVDSAAVYVNASTRFTDGGEFGNGCEIGISTQKLHARGPMGLNELNTYKYVIQGNGQIRV